MNIRSLSPIVGILITILGIMMVFPIIIDISFGSYQWQYFAVSMIITCFLGIGLYFAGRGTSLELDNRMGFMLVAFTWILLPIFSSIPFILSDLHASFTDSYFESMSAITTTGSTVFINLDRFDPGLLLWRGILQWLGGIGILVMAISILPTLSIGGMQLFKMEFTDNIEGVSPRLSEISIYITSVYIFLTAFCFLAYSLNGIKFLDALVLALTTMSTGGMANHDDSFHFYNNVNVEYIAIIFMILAGMPFILFAKFVRGNQTALFKDSQVRWYLTCLLTFTCLIFAYRWMHGEHDFENIARESAFSVVSIMTGTGFASADYASWGALSGTVFLFITFIGGCAGSTSCGIKVFRFQVVFQTIKIHIAHMLHPNGVFVAKFNGMKISDQVTNSVLSFFVIYIACFAIIALSLVLLGLDDVTAISATSTTLSNVGPGLGDIVGPTGNFSSLSDSVKWVLCLSMLLGRLEIFTILVLLSTRFWKY